MYCVGLSRTCTVTALKYCCSFVGLIVFIVIICKSLWIKASAQWLNVNEMFWKICSPIRNSICTLSCWLLKGRSNLMMMMNSLFLRTMRLVFLYWLVLCAFLLSVTRISTLSTERARVAGGKDKQLTWSFEYKHSCSFRTIKKTY